jgi:hypothetical protein
MVQLASPKFQLDIFIFNPVEAEPAAELKELNAFCKFAFVVVFPAKLQLEISIVALEAGTLAL